MDSIRNDMKMVFITGGTGFRHVARELAQRTKAATYVINVSDSGGSSRPLRFCFNLPAIGDMRSRIIDIADRNRPGYQEITALLAHRLGADPSPPAGSAPSPPKPCGPRPGSCYALRHRPSPHTSSRTVCFTGNLHSETDSGPCTDAGPQDGLGGPGGGG